MNSKIIMWGAAGGLVLAVTVGSARAAAQSANEPVAQPQLGSVVFTSYCATCHGKDATGNGPLAAMLRKTPANLTLLAKKNGGVFSSQIVARIIDGRDPVMGHGGGDMPVWGDAFSRSSDGPDATAGKITALVTYLESIQQKP